MRIQIEIDDRLLHQAMKATGLTAKRTVIGEGLRLVIKVKEQAGIRQLRGKVQWVGERG
jgi:Arc/MetJ family transcription regulator